MRVFKVRLFYMADYNWVEFEAIASNLGKLKKEIFVQYPECLIKEDSLTIEESSGDIQMPYFFNLNTWGCNPENPHAK